MARIGFALLLVVVVACSERNGDVQASWEDEGSRVADDAGRIPLTTPGTAPLVERPVMTLPLPPLEEVPAPVPEEPVDAPPPEAAIPDTGAAPRRSVTPPRQPSASDTIGRTTPVPVPSTPPAVSAPAPPTPQPRPSQPVAPPPPPPSPIPGGDTGANPGADPLR